MCELIYCVYANVHIYYITTKIFQDFFKFKKHITIQSHKRQILTPNAKQTFYGLFHNKKYSS